MHRHPWRPRRAIDCLALAGLLAVTGCGHTVDHKISDRVEAALPSLVGPADSYTVTTATDAFVALNGKIRSVEVDGRGVRLSPSVTMDALHIGVHDIVVDTRTRRLSSFGQVDYTARLGQENLDRYLTLTAARPGRPKEFGVTLGENDLATRFTVGYLGFEVPVTVRGTLKVDPSDAARLDFVPSKGALGFVPIPTTLLQVALDRINPIVDVSRLRAPLTVSDVQVQHGQIMVSGTAKITPAMLAALHQ